MRWANRTNHRLMLCPRTYKWDSLTLRRGKNRAKCGLCDPKSLQWRNLTLGGRCMISDTVKITVKNLRLRTFIGFNPEEREKQQDVIINLDLHYKNDAPAIQDEPSATVDYKKITKAIIAHVEGGRFLLLEKLTEDILAIAADHPKVCFAQATVDKPHALRFSDSVAVTLEYNAIAS